MKSAQAALDAVAKKVAERIAAAAMERDLTSNLMMEIDQTAIGSSHSGKICAKRDLGVDASDIKLYERQMEDVKAYSKRLQRRMSDALRDLQEGGVAHHKQFGNRIKARYAYRPDQKFTHEEAKLLDMCLLVHADHGGGNCSTFTARVLSSSGTDTYSAIAAAIGALKGPKHGGANLMVNRQLQDILKHVEHPEDDDEVREYLRRILRKQAGDGSGLIYGMGHAVYTMSDPREVILKERAKHLAYEKGFEEEYNMLCSIERLAPGIFAEEKGSTKPVCANVDLFSGLIYNMLGISEDLYTPLFAIARVPGWCAHRVEEVVFANRIIRPAYKYLGVRQKYKPIEER